MSELDDAARDEGYGSHAPGLDDATVEAMRCPDCGMTSYLRVDGRMMTEDQINHLPRPPRKIERRLPHKVWCPSMDNRLRVGFGGHRG
jgi:hypothetical protein